MTPHLTILGGGPCGLYAAHTALELGARVSLLEKESVFGGLAAGTQMGKNWYDMGVHMLHAFDAEIFATCARVMAGERLEVPLNARIKWGGKLYHYPLRGRDILAGIPPLTLARCLVGLLGAELCSRSRRSKPSADAESALIALYGTPLYRFFFENFTHRYWGLHPRELSAEFVRSKMPRLSAVDVVKNLIEKLHLASPRDATEGALRFETLHYSKTGAETLPRTLAQDLSARGAELLTEAPILRIAHDGCTITEVETPKSRHHTADSCVISTLPLPVFLRALDPAPATEILVAADGLAYKPMAVHALLVHKARCMDGLYTYYRDRIFHRVAEPKNAGMLVDPPGHTILIVETTCECGDAKWTGKAYPQILADLSAEGLCRSSDIVEHHILHATHAYPVFALGFDQHLQTVLGYLSRFSNLRTTGRQGAFTYPNMHAAMRMGAQAATDLLSPNGAFQTGKS